MQNVLGIFREMRWSSIPPLMVYLAAGVSGFTGIIESFYAKEELGLSAAFLASLGFWAGLPWALKMPLGHLVDLYWHRKSLFVYFGKTSVTPVMSVMTSTINPTRIMTRRASTAPPPAGSWPIRSAILMTS